MSLAVSPLFALFLSGLFAGAGSTAQRSNVQVISLRCAEDRATVVVTAAETASLVLGLGLDKYRVNHWSASKEMRRPCRT